MDTSSKTAKKNGSISEVAKVFFKLGLFAFGGPAAHVAMMEDEVVTKRKWMDRQHFLDLMGATNLIPGPNSTEMTMHCGHERAGTLGLFVAGISFIFPAVVLTGLLAWLYVEYGQLPEIAPFVIGIKPAVLVIIAGAIYKLGKKALKGWELGILAAIVVVSSILGVNEVLALLGAGVLGAIYFSAKNGIGEKSNIKKGLPLVLLQVPVASATVITTANIFWTFLKVGAVLYGSGYVLFAYLDAELVTNGWMSRQELVDAIAVGQFTPGPVLSTATFVGYQLNGIWGALAATAGIFLPSFLFVLILNPLVPKMRQSKVLGYFLDSVNVAAVAVMLSVLFEMSREILIDWRPIVITLLAAILAFGFKKSNAMILVLGGSVLGFLLSLI